MEELVTENSSKYYGLLEDSDDDEWYYSSIPRFELLQMFNFETPAYHLDLSEDAQICCTGKIRNNQQEIQEFVLPEKFSTSALESHDLKLKTGGFSTNPVYQMKCLRGLRKLVVTEESTLGASVYELGRENSDFIKKVGDINCNVMKPQLAVYGNKVALGSSTHNIHLADVSTGKILLQSPQSTAEEILGLSFVNDYLLAYCERKPGQVRLVDCRSNDSKVYTSVNPKSCKVGDCSAKVWHSFSVQQDRNCFGLISSKGDIVIYDSRSDCHFPLLETKLEIDSSSPGGCSLQLVFSPHNEDVFSASGMNGNVDVFSFETGAIIQIFSYDGHNRHRPDKKVFISNHIWSPIQRNLLFSSAKDGSFHCWKFVENKTSSAM